jgi:hypothetical protein
MPASSTVAPAHHAPGPVPIAPFTWNSGNPHRNTWPGRSPMNSRRSHDMNTSLACVCRAILGVPVVPPVWK